jgi:hypothetical protein
VTGEIAHDGVISADKAALTKFFAAATAAGSAKISVSLPISDRASRISLSLSYGPRRLTRAKQQPIVSSNYRRK